MTITYELKGNLYINLTNRCPNRCDFCLRTRGNSVGHEGSLWLEREPTREEIWADLQKRDLTLYPQVVFCGYGEPTCRLSDMLWLCGKLRETSSANLRVNTNGLSDLINGRNTAPEFDGLLDVVSVSLNAPTPERYDEICHSQFGLDALPAILRFTSNVGLYVPTVCMTVVDRDLTPGEISQCEALCSRTGARFRVRKFISDNVAYK